MSAETDNSPLFMGIDMGRDDSTTVVLVHAEHKPTRVLTEREEIDLLLKRVERLEEGYQRLRQQYMDWKDDNK